MQVTPKRGGKWPLKDVVNGFIRSILSEKGKRLAWFKIGISVLCLGFIIRLVASKGLGVDSFGKAGLVSTSDTGVDMLAWLTLATILMLANIGLEAAKWRLCLSGLQKNDDASQTVEAGQGLWWLCVRATLAGIALGFPLTHTVGDYSGKLTAAAAPLRWAAFRLAVQASLSQYWVAITGGLVGGYYAYLYAGRFVAEWVQPLAIAGLPFWVLLTAGVFYFDSVYAFARNLPLLGPALKQEIERRKGQYGTTTKQGDFGNGAVNWTREEIEENDSVGPSPIGLLLLSIGRYWAILAQYAALFAAFYPGKLQLVWLAAVAVLLLIKTLIPLLSLGGFIGAREALGLILLSPLGVPTGVVLAVSLSIWVINLAIPGAIGAVLLSWPVSISKRAVVPIKSENNAE
jgi:hypothetical protein